MNIKKFPQYILAVLLPSILGGCGIQEDTLASQAKPSQAKPSQAKPSQASGSARQPNSIEVNPDRAEILHDFGMLRPGVRVSHDFAVENPTKEDWVLEKVIQSCTCSVATASSQTIKAGKVERFRFDYHAPNGFADERRSVSLTFRGKADHLVDLVCTAQIRPAMTLRSAGLNFGNVPVGGVGQRSLEIDNYGPTGWSGVEAMTLPKGITISRRAKVERDRKGIPPRETWAVEVRVDGGSLSPGAFRDEIPFRADGDAKAILPVEFVVGVPVVVRPSLLMLGQVERSRPAEATTTLRFFGGKAPCLPGELDVKVVGLKLTSKNVTVVTGDTWKVVVGVEPSDDLDVYLSGQLILGFPKGNPPEVTIPIEGRVRPRS